MSVKRSPIRILGAPREVAVTADRAGVPVRVGGRAVTGVRDEWRVEEGWWTGDPVRRRYFDLVLAGGRSSVVFLDRRRGRWFTQRA